MHLILIQQTTLLLGHGHPVPQGWVTAWSQHSRGTEGSRRGDPGSLGPQGPGGVGRRLLLWGGGVGGGAAVGPSPSLGLPLPSCCPALSFTSASIITHCLLSHLCFLAFWFLLTWCPGVSFYLSEDNFLFPLPSGHSQGHTAGLVTTFPKGS